MDIIQQGFNSAINVGVFRELCVIPFLKTIVGVAGILEAMHASRDPGVGVIKKTYKGVYTKNSSDPFNWYSWGVIPSIFLKFLLK